MQVQNLRVKLQAATDRCSEMERDRKEQINRIKAEVYENSHNIMKEVTRGQQEATETAQRRIQQLEAEVEQMRASVSGGEELAAALEAKSAECIELMQALEELEAEKVADSRSARAAQADAEAEMEGMRRRLEEAKHRIRELEEIRGQLEAQAREQAARGGARAGIDAEADDADDARAEALRDAEERIEGLTEERENLQAKLMQAEEDNQRSQREINKLSQMAETLQAKAHEYMRECQSVVEMEQRNMKWCAPGPAPAPPARPARPRAPPARAP